MKIQAVRNRKINTNILIFFLLVFTLFSCENSTGGEDLPDDNAYRITKNVSYDGIYVDVVIDKPENNEVDVLIVYHGTVRFDSKILEAANKTLNAFQRILDRDDMMIVSVAYPEEGLLFGENVSHSEAAFLWVKNKANQELGINVKKVFLAGHSQGGYIVTRLNTMHKTSGVIANAPGPFNLVYRCQLEENGQIPNGQACTLLRNAFGTTEKNPDKYYERSLLNFTSGFKSDILFVQGMDDKPIQMYSWPVFKQQVNDCMNCQNTIFLELSGFGHQALFQSSQAKEVFNDFIDSR